MINLINDNDNRVLTRILYVFITLKPPSVRVVWICIVGINRILVSNVGHSVDIRRHGQWAVDPGRVRLPRTTCIFTVL